MTAAAASVGAVVVESARLRDDPATGDAAAAVGAASAGPRLREGPATGDGADFASDAERACEGVVMAERSKRVRHAVSKTSRGQCEQRTHD